MPEKMPWEMGFTEAASHSSSPSASAPGISGQMPWEMGLKESSQSGKQSTLSDFEKRTIAKESKGSGSAITAGLGRVTDALTFGTPIVDYASAGLNYAVNKARGGKSTFGHELEYSRALKRATEEANPISTRVGDVVGIGASFAMPGGFIAKGVTKALPVAQKVATKFPALGRFFGGAVGQGAEGATIGAVGGAARGYGTDEGALGGAVKGAAFGGALGGAMGGGMEIAKPLAFKAITAATGRSPGLVENYYKNLGRMAGAPDVDVAGDNLAQALSKVSTDLKINGGQEAARVLAESGKTIPPSKLKEIISAPFDEAMERAATESDRRLLKSAKEDFTRRIDDEFGPRLLAAEKVSQIKGPNAQDFVIPAIRRPEQPVPLSFLRNQVSALQDKANFSGEKSSLLEAAAGRGQHDLNAFLKGPDGAGEAYQKVMDEQLKRAMALDAFGMKSKFNPATGKYEYNQDSLDKILKSVASEKPTRQATLKISRLADAMPEGQGQKLMEDAKLSYLKHAFDSSNPNGSRQVNFYGNLGEGAGELLGGLVPGTSGGPGRVLGKVLGSIAGFGGDKFAAPMARRAMELGHKLETRWDRISPRNQAMLKAAAARGPQQVMIASEILMDKDPSYREAIGGGDVDQK